MNKFCSRRNLCINWKKKRIIKVTGSEKKEEEVVGSDWLSEIISIMILLEISWLCMVTRINISSEKNDIKSVLEVLQTIDTKPLPNFQVWKTMY